MSPRSIEIIEKKKSQRALIAGETRDNGSPEETLTRIKKRKGRTLHKGGNDLWLSSTLEGPHTERPKDYSLGTSSYASYHRNRKTNVSRVEIKVVKWSTQEEKGIYMNRRRREPESRQRERGNQNGSATPQERGGKRSEGVKEMGGKWERGLEGRYCPRKGSSEG